MDGNCSQYLLCGALSEDINEFKINIHNLEKHRNKLFRSSLW